MTVRISPQLLPPEVFSPPLPGSLQVWDIRQKNAIQTLNNTYQITTVAFNDTNEQLFSGGIDNEIKVWRMFYNHTHTHMYMYFGTWKSFPPFLSPLPLPPSLPPFLSPLPPSLPPPSLLPPPPFAPKTRTLFQSNYLDILIRGFSPSSSSGVGSAAEFSRVFTKRSCGHSHWAEPQSQRTLPPLQ